MQALSLCLTREALSVARRMPITGSRNYEKLVLPLQRRFKYTSECHGEKFMKSRPEKGETGT